MEAQRIDEPSLNFEAFCRADITDSRCLDAIGEFERAQRDPEPPASIVRHLDPSILSRIGSSHAQFYHAYFEPDVNSGGNCASH